MKVAREMATKDNIDWLLHIDVDDCFTVLGDRKSNISGRWLFRKNHRHYSWVEKILSGVNRLAVEFNYYGSGKSAARISEVKFAGVHDFQLKDSSQETPYASNIHSSVNEPLILHYPICNFETFWKKCRILGDLSDKWFDSVSILPFHRQSRDVVRSGDREKGTESYVNKVMLRDKVIRLAITLGSVVRITYSADLLIGVQPRNRSEDRKFRMSH